MAANRLALQERQPASPTLARFAEVARLLTGNPNADAADGEQWVGDLVRKLGIPGLRAFGVAEEHVPELVKRGLQASSMKANPIRLSQEELEKIILLAI
jgi:alcohol dehydrogenase class IV